jgi:hypothetical protein
LAGPYDYGVVVVRVAIHVDPHDAHVFADSETVPKIIGGIPIRMRSIQVNINKPTFMINPTNCSPFSVVSHGIGDQGTSVAFSSFYRASDCGTLPFKPRFAIKLLGKKTKRSQNPSLQFDLYTRPGDANIRTLAVTLSKAFQIDQSHLGNICTEKELSATNCAGRTAIGTATTETPLLDGPLSGPVYAVSGSGGLPKLAFILDGQVSLTPRAESASNPSGALRTVVPIVPDAEIGHFRFHLNGGKLGYLSNTRSLCAAPPFVTVEYSSQNGLERAEKVKPRVTCSKHRRKVRRRR